MRAGRVRRYRSFRRRGPRHATGRDMQSPTSCGRVSALSVAGNYIEQSFGSQCLHRAAPCIYCIVTPLLCPSNHLEGTNHEPRLNVLIRAMSPSLEGEFASSESAANLDEHVKSVPFSAPPLLEARAR